MSCAVCAVGLCGLTVPHRRLMRADYRCAVIIRCVQLGYAVVYCGTLIGDDRT